MYSLSSRYEDVEGVSPTEREFDKATEKGNHRIIFIKRCTERDPKETKFIKRVEEQLVRKGFNDFEELRTSVYSSLIRFLEDNEYLRFLPWDASLHRTATLDDIDREKVKSFVALAKEKRGFLHLNTNRSKTISYPSSGGRVGLKMSLRFPLIKR